MNGFYNDNDLKRIQEMELGILKDFINLCEKYKLKYFLIGGSALGAVRHKGFIPWDDDIDVALPREDYEKFLNIAAIELSDKYNVINAENYDEYPLLTTQLALKGTKFVTENFKDLNIPFGIYLDIFPFDGMCNDWRKAKKHAKKTWFFGKMQILSCISKPYVPFKGFKRKIIWACTSLVHHVLKLLGVSPHKIYVKTKNMSMKYNSCDNKYLNHFCDSNYMWNVIEVNELYPLKKMEFEGIWVNVPNKPEKHLIRAYGDFMTLPPPEKRKNHYPYSLDFGKYGQ